MVCHRLILNRWVKDAWGHPGSRAHSSLAGPMGCSHAEITQARHADTPETFSQTSWLVQLIRVAMALGLIRDAHPLPSLRYPFRGGIAAYCMGRRALAPA